jgi:hypothetical protein
MLGLLPLGYGDVESGYGAAAPIQRILTGGPASMVRPRASAPQRRLDPTVALRTQIQVLQTRLKVAALPSQRKKLKKAINDLSKKLAKIEKASKAMSRPRSPAVSRPKSRPVSAIRTVPMVARPLGPIQPIATPVPAHMRISEEALEKCAIGIMDDEMDPDHAEVMSLVSTLNDQASVLMAMAPGHEKDLLAKSVVNYERRLYEICANRIVAKTNPSPGLILGLGIPVLIGILALPTFVINPWIVKAFKPEWSYWRRVGAGMGITFAVGALRGIAASLSGSDKDEDKSTKLDSQQGDIKYMDTSTQNITR